ncbi:ATP-binding cassette domain-containing protein [Bacillus spongiae]|uniref:ATP-binding cassette domain-containing protein n=1 Tax=Bacillus spongiae TaxID=2683610 RepID=A0ABU8HH47_9BACI
MIEVRSLTGGYGNKEIIRNVTFSVKQGEMYGILGPNGSGKTTLLKMMTGLLPYQRGSISIAGKELSQYSAKELAQTTAVLPQMSMQSFSYSVKEIVSLGRYSHQQGMFKSWSPNDEEIVQEVMELTGIKNYENVFIEQLSGGERQRVFLAQALAQQPKLLLLDEPTNHLDLAFQKSMLDTLKTWTIERGLTVLSIFHDLNLASLYCDTLLLLADGSVQKVEQPSKVLSERNITTVYQTKVQKIMHPHVAKPQIVLLPNVAEASSQPHFSLDLVERNDEKVVIQTSKPVKVMSTAIEGEAVGWFTAFFLSLKNDRVQSSEMLTRLIQKEGLIVEDTIAMMTPRSCHHISSSFYDEGKISFMMVVSLTKGIEKGSISVDHIMIFFNGYLSEATFLQAFMAVTEAKAAINCGKEESQSSNYSSPSITVAATQMGERLRDAGPHSPIGKRIKSSIDESIKEAKENK